MELTLSCTLLNFAIFWTIFRAFSFLPLQRSHLRDSGISWKKSARMTTKLGKVAITKRALQDDKYMDMTGVKIEDKEYESITVQRGMIRSFSEQYSKTVKKVDICW